MVIEKMTCSQTLSAFVSAIIIMITIEETADIISHIFETKYQK